MDASRAARNAELAAELDALARQDLARRRQLVDGYGRHGSSVEVHCSGRSLVSFCSNDYLGLARDPRVGEAFATAAADGTGSGASHLVTGHHRAHASLEAALARFVGRERALLFSSGYLANLAVATALAGRGDRIVADRLNHASLVDGARLSGARLRRYRHGDATAARALLATAPAGRRLLLTDGVFSMDGDVAPIPSLAAACRAHDAWLIVDDAHGLGVLGARGGGALEACGADTGDVPVLIGTLGKALGTYGAFVAGDAPLIEWLEGTARPYVYTTALPPAVAAAAECALSIAAAEPWRRERLARLTERLRAGARALGLVLADSPTPIQPLIVGDASRALRAAAALRARGLWVAPIRPPTVPRGSARLRITLSAAHRDEDVEHLLEGLADLGPWLATPGTAP